MNIILDNESKKNLIRLAIIIAVMWLVSCTKKIDVPACRSAKCMVGNIDDHVPKRPIKIVTSDYVKVLNDTYQGARNTHTFYINSRADSATVIITEGGREVFRKTVQQPFVPVPVVLGIMVAPLRYYLQIHVGGQTCIIEPTIWQG